ncbi:MAG: metallophosphoesterase, partial [Hyphomicrobiaceae bacterium]
MRLQVFSDVHFDIEDDYCPVLAPGVDVVVVPGDLCEGMDGGMAWLRKHLGDAVEIVFVPGNHEYFARVHADERKAGEAVARRHRVHLLDQRITTLGGVRFIGATLWADYCLYGADRQAEMMEVARQRMMDHRRILVAPGRHIAPEDSLALHDEARAFLARELAKPHDGPTVVVSHHGPHPRCLAEKYRANLLSAAFISDLSEMISTYQPDVWVHGHTHVSLDFLAGHTRVVCNPRGYR